MLHEPAAQTDTREFASGRKARLGIWLFWIYFLIYAGFVGINTFFPQALEADVLFGMNLAVAYGFGLILLAIALGLAYNHVCTRFEDEARDAAGKEA